MLPVVKMQILARFSVSALVASLPLLYISLLRPPPAALAGDTAFWFLMSNGVIAAIVVAADAGTLFFGSSKADTPCSCHDDSLSYVAPLSGTDAAFEEASTMTSSNSIVDGALPFCLVHGEGDEEPSTDKKVILLKGQGREEELARPPSSSGDAILGADGALPVSEPEPGLVEEEIHEAWARAQHSRTPDLQQGRKGAGEGKLRRSATEGSKPAAAEDRDYWELSDEELNRRVEEFIARFNREMRRQIEQEAAGV